MGTGFTANGQLVRHNIPRHAMHPVPCTLHSIHTIVIYVYTRICAYTFCAYVSHCELCTVELTVLGKH